LSEEKKRPGEGPRRSNAAAPPASGTVGAPDAQDVAALIESRRTRGMTLNQLVSHFAADSSLDRAELRRRLRKTLRRLESEGRVVPGRGKRYFGREISNLVRGRLEVRAGGVAVVEPEAAGKPPVVIGKAGLRGAMAGDTVLVRVERPRRRARVAGMAEGVVVKILERPQRHVVGRWTMAGGRPIVRPVNRKLAFPIIPKGPLPSPGPREGEFVVVDLLKGPDRSQHAQGRVREVLGLLGEPGVEDRVVLRFHDIPGEFPGAALEEAAALPGGVEGRDLAGRWDLRDRPAITIDGITARDFDDAVSARPGRDGAILVEVHIADVSHYVNPGGALDAAARERGTSVYLPGRCVPMLPERLSNDLCSLREDVDRLTLTVVFDVDPQGKVARWKARPSVIHSRRRCTYAEVASWLELPRSRWPRETAGFSDSLQLLAEAAERLGARRRERGSIDFDLEEPEVILDPEGRVVSIEPGSRNRAHRLIEELMVTANECVARILMEADQPAIYRVHDVPTPERLADLRTVVTELGFEFPEIEHPFRPSVLQDLLEQAAGTEHQRLVSFLVLRTLARAVYTPEPRGHFALATDTYLHFTSPIRRYPDLVVHRSLRALVASGGGPLEPGDRAQVDAELERVAQWCSQTERRAEAAERMALHWKKVLYLQDRVGEVFRGHVVGVTEFGLFVQLDELYVDGLIHITELVDDFYVHDLGRHTLTGEKTGRTWRLGDAVEVRLSRIDLNTMQLALVPVDMTPDRKMRKGRRGRRRVAGE